MSGGYDRALTVFSPDGHLLQVEYAAEAVRRGTCAVGIRANDCVVLAAEKRAAAKLQDSFTTQKIVELEDQLALAFAGLQADARVLVDMARVECQSYFLNMAVSPSVDYIGTFVSRVQQKYTIKGGRRPFGISTLIAGFSTDGKPGLLQTEPHGILTSWQAQAIGRNAKTVQEFLEKHITSATSSLSQETAVRLSVEALLEVVETVSGQPGVSNIELVVTTRNGATKYDDRQIAKVIDEIGRQADGTTAT